LLYSYLPGHFAFDDIMLEGVGDGSLDKYMLDELRKLSAYKCQLQVRRRDNQRMWIYIYSKSTPLPTRANSRGRQILDVEDRGAVLRRILDETRAAMLAFLNRKAGDSQLEVCDED
jgi:hypothetical protein